MVWRTVLALSSKSQQTTEYTPPLCTKTILPIIDYATLGWGFTRVCSVHRTDKNSVTLKYDGPDPVRGAVATGTRVFLKHFANTQSWGVYGWKIQGHFTLQGVSLWACGGMGLRCDFCDGVFRIESSTVGKRPGTVRPMSTTADASHAMHHRGAVELVDSRFEWQGDDGCVCGASHRSPSRPFLT